MTETQTLIEVPDYITVRELATEMGVSPIDVIKELMSNGIMANINQQIDFDTASIVAEEMGFEVVAPAVVVKKKRLKRALAGVKSWLKKKKQDLEPRPPVVTMLGHVDHGKTSLLDVIRQTECSGG